MHCLFYIVHFHLIIVKKFYVLFSTVVSMFSFQKSSLYFVLQLVFLFNNTLLIRIAIRRYKWPSGKTLLQYGKQVVFNQLILLFWSFSYPLSPIQEKWYILWKKWYLPTFNFWIVTKPFQLSRVLIFVTQISIARLRYLSTFWKI